MVFIWSRPISTIVLLDGLDRFFNRLSTRDKFFSVHRVSCRRWRCKMHRNKSRLCACELWRGMGGLVGVIWPPPYGQLVCHRSDEGWKTTPSLCIVWTKEKKVGLAPSCVGLSYPFAILVTMVVTIMTKLQCNAIGWPPNDFLSCINIDLTHSTGIFSSGRWMSRPPLSRCSYLIF